MAQKNVKRIIPMPDMRWTIPKRKGTIPMPKMKAPENWDAPRKFKYREEIV